MEVVGLFEFQRCCCVLPLVFLLTQTTDCQWLFPGLFVEAWSSSTALCRCFFCVLLRATLQISDASTPPRSLDIRCSVPLFLFNILGKGCFGYIFPRQELAFKQYTWFVHGCCWWTFHIRLKSTNDPHPDYFHHIVRGSKDKEYLVRYHHSQPDQWVRFSVSGI